MKVTEAQHQNEQSVPLQQTPQMHSVAVDPPSWQSRSLPQTCPLMAPEHWHTSSWHTVPVCGVQQLLPFTPHVAQPNWGTTLGMQFGSGQAPLQQRSVVPPWVEVPQMVPSGAC